VRAARPFIRIRCATVCAQFPLLKDVGDATLRRLLSEATWFGLPGGTLLARDGEMSQALFLVVTGSLGVFVEDEKAHRRLVSLVPAGETVGEMSLISGEPTRRSSSPCVTASFLRISRDGFPGADRTTSPRDVQSDAHPRAAPAGRDASAVRRREAKRPSPSSPYRKGLADEPIASASQAALVEMGSESGRARRKRRRANRRTGSTRLKRRAMSSSIAATRQTAPGRICA